MILQLIDDHSRLAVDSRVAWKETAEEAIAVFDKAAAAHGLPQRLLTDNGSALNPSRRGYLGRLVKHLARLGVQAITGKPYEPTTQGKNERFHQTLFRYLDKQPLANTLAELQAQVDAFDDIYNNERPHQGLPGRVTGSDPQGGSSSPTAQPALVRPTRTAADPTRTAADPTRTAADPPAETRVMRLSTAGTVMLAGVRYKVDGRLACEQVLVVTDGDTITVADLDGEVLIEHTRPAPGIRYVGNGRPRGPRRNKDETSPKS